MWTHNLQLICSEARGGAAAGELLPALAARDARAEQASPLGGHLCVDAVSGEDEEALQRSSQGEEDQENLHKEYVSAGATRQSTNRLRDTLRDEIDEVTEHPGETD